MIITLSIAVSSFQRQIIYYLKLGDVRLTMCHVDICNY